MLPIVEKLKNADVSLFNSYEALKEIVINDYFPKMPVDQNYNSLNSFPHIKNLESYLDQLLSPYPDLFSPKSHVHLTPQELYIILSAIWLHDIGRIRENKQEEGEKKEKHGTHSKIIIEQNYVHLRIESLDQAKAIGKICEFHEPSEDYKDELNTVLTDKGFIRVRELASLLVLIDNMDSTYLRLTPLFVTGKENHPDLVSSFREVLRGIRFDEKRKSVIVYLDNDFNNEKKKSDFSYNPLDWKVKYNLNESFVNIVITPNSDILGHVGYSPMDDQFKLLKALLVNKSDKKDLDNIYLSELIDQIKSKLYTNLGDGNHELNQVGYDNLKPYLDYVKKHNEFAIDDTPQNNYRSIIRLFHKDELNNPGTNVDQLITLLINDILKMKIDKGGKWPAIIKLSAILSSARIGANDLKKRCQLLQRIGLPVNSWLILFKDRLYNFYGNETFEPIFTKHYLIDVAECMWKLSSQVFGQSFFSYQTLASAMIEPDIDKTKMAVERLSILTKDNDNNKHLIWSDNTGWQRINNKETYKVNNSIINTFKDLSSFIVKEIDSPIL